MTTNAYFKFPKILRRLHKGPLGDYIDLYAAQLLREGHCYQSGARCIRIVGDFSQWPARQPLTRRCRVRSTLSEYWPG
jgi:hypothetical protein